MIPYGVLSLTGFREDGSAYSQVWMLSEEDRAYLAGVLAKTMGEPHSETVSTAESVEQVGGMALNAPGSYTTFPGLPS